SSEPRGPVIQLLCDVRPLEPLTLPRSEIAVLNAQRLEPRSRAPRECFVARQQLTQQKTERPAIAHHVMKREKEDVLARASLQQATAKQRSTREVERRHRFGKCAIAKFGIPCRTVGVLQIQSRKRERHFVVDDLNGLSVDLRESGAQDFVSPDDFFEGALE